MANEIRCSRCHIEKPAEQFTKREKRCRDCRAEAARERWAANPGRPGAEAVLGLEHDGSTTSRTSLVWEQDYAERRAAGWTRDPAYLLFFRASAYCAICREPETARDSRGVVKPLTVDHDHDTGAVRALLCNSCNLMLGAARDRAALLRQGAEYVERYRQ